MDQPIANRSWLVDEAYAALKETILTNQYAPGQQVSAQELATRLGMSRTPVQEAALRLQQEGLVEILPKRGIRIRALTPEDLAEIYEVILAIEAGAAELIAAMDPAARVAIADALDERTDAMEQALRGEDRDSWGAADAAFHQLLVDRSGNRRFAAIMATVNAQSHRARMITVHLRPALPLSIDEHRGIAQALRAGDVAAAGAAARAHRARARSELLPLVQKLGLRHL